MKPRSFFEAVNCAVEGIIHALRSQRHMMVHFIAAVMVIIVSLALDVTVVDFTLLCLLVGLVITTELINTAVEYVMDILQEDFHVKVKYVKDICAGAVLFNSLLAFFLGAVIFSKYSDRSSEMSQRLSSGSITLAVISLALVVIAVIAVKAFFRTGRPLRGGMPSGHAAVSFSLWVSLSMYTQHPLLLGAALLAALIVSFSRLYRGIHRGDEVLAGALLGSGITYLVFTCFRN